MDHYVLRLGIFSVKRLSGELRAAGDAAECFVPDRRTFKLHPQLNPGERYPTDRNFQYREREEPVRSEFCLPG